MTPRRGYMLLEMMITIALVAIALTMATTLVTRTIRVNGGLANSERDQRAIEQLLLMLQRDVETSTILELSDQSLTLDNNIVWSIDNDHAVRRSDTERRWEVRPKSIHLTDARFGLMVEISTPGKMAKQIALINRTRWAKESLR